MAEGARLESVYTATYRGFESPPHRHIQERARTKVRAFFFIYSPLGDENPRPGFDNWRSQLDRPARSERAAPKGRAKRVNPPLTAIFKKELVRKYGLFSLYIPHWGMRIPDRGSTTGVASWTDRRAANGLPRRGEQSESIPPHRHIQKRARTKVRAFFSH